jgi:hypothetical protein
MALPALATSDLLRMNKDEQFEYFCSYARFDPTSPQKPYAIRIGGKSLFSDDTMELRRMFNKAVGLLRRREHFARKGRG